MRTEKMVRGVSHWVKITRKENKDFSLAWGCNGDFKAAEIRYWPAKHMPTWKDAVAQAEQMIEDWK
jgi:hypothetical protein